MKPTLEEQAGILVGMVLLVIAVVSAFISCGERVGWRW